MSCVALVPGNLIKLLFARGRWRSLDGVGAKDLLNDFTLGSVGIVMSVINLPLTNKYVQKYAYVIASNGIMGWLRIDYLKETLDVVHE